MTVNLDLANGYALLQRQDPSVVLGIGPDPVTPLHPQQFLPRLGGLSTRDSSYTNRIIGEIVLGDPFSVLAGMLGRQDSIRADEGGPFDIGTGLSLADEVTVHALEHSIVHIGSNCRFGFHSLVHGGEDVNSNPHEVTSLGNNVTVGNRAVVFRSTLNNNCTVGEGAFVDGCQLPDGT